MEYDCLLLEHVFGQRPDDAQKVKQFVLDTIASDPGLQQTELVFLGLFGRACRVLEDRNAQVAALCHQICSEPHVWAIGLNSCWLQVESWLLGRQCMPHKGSEQCCAKS